jgi:hypothetical protein
MADRLAVGEHEVGRHIGPHEPLEQRLACERLPVPEARNLRVGMPADEEVDVVVLDRAKRRLRPVNRNRVVETTSFKPTRHGAARNVTARNG